MMDHVDILIVNCAFDIGISPTTLFRTDLYARLRTLVAHLKATRGDPEDVYYPGMAQIDRDLVAIFSEYMQPIYQSTIVRTT